MKPHIHYHSDCPFFAGCENMLANFFNSEELAKEFDLSFSYRFSTIYQEGFRARVKRPTNSKPLNLFDLSQLTGSIGSSPARNVVKIISYILFVKYWFVFFNAVILIKEFKKRKIDILHINNGGYPGAYSCMAAVFAARICRVPIIIFVVNNVAFNYSSPSRWLDYPLDRLLRNIVTLFITGSEYARQRLIDVLSLRSDQAINIPNGITVRELTETKAQVLDRLVIPKDKLIIGVVAILEKRKGHIYLLKALNILKNEGVSPLPMLLIEGDGPMEDGLKSFVRDNELSDIVRFIGNEANIFNLLNTVDVVILPSISNEDFPNVVLEAMSLGKAVIGSRISGVPEQIEDGKSGIIVEPGDISGLANAIKKILADQSLSESFGVNAKRRFNEQFQAGVSVAKYLSLYRELLNAKKLLKVK